MAGLPPSSFDRSHEEQENTMDTDVLVIGGGAAGLAAATRVRAQAPATRVTVLDPSPFNTYRPWFMYALPGLLPVGDLQIPLAQLAEQSGFTFRQAAMEKLDPGSNTVLAGGEPLRYRRVVLAVGAPTDRNAVPGAAQHAVFPCDVDGFATFQQRLASLDGGTVSVVVTGERLGPGLEEAAWLARAHGQSGSRRLRVRLVADGETLLEQLGRRTLRRVSNQLESWGAETVLGVSVQSIGPDHIALADGRTLPSAVTAVVGPLRGPDLQTRGLADERGFFAVAPTLQSAKEPAVFVAGDAVARGAGGLRRSWQLAVRQAHVAAENAVRSLAGEPLVSFDARRDRRISKFYLPDVGGTAFLVWNRRLLSSGPAARRIRIGFDRKHFEAYLPADPRWRRIPG
jgi:NADH dehydrogenase FAD-containing subunit